MTIKQRRIRLQKVNFKQRLNEKISNERRDSDL